MTELHVFDFDGTLFRSPDRPDWWGPGEWWTQDVSLSHPCVPTEPNPEWWINSTVTRAHQSIQNPNVWTVLVTGRLDGKGGFRYRIPELLKQVGLDFDGVYLNDDQDTAQFKAKTISSLLTRFPHVEVVRMWDDQDNNMGAVRGIVSEIWGKDFDSHLVSTDIIQPPLCSREDMDKLVDEGWVPEKVAARWVSRQATRLYAPPKLVDAVFEWARSTLAAYQIQKLQKEMKDNQKYRQEEKSKADTLGAAVGVFKRTLQGTYKVKALWEEYGKLVKVALEMAPLAATRSVSDLMGTPLPKFRDFSKLYKDGKLQEHLGNRLRNLSDEIRRAQEYGADIAKKDDQKMRRLRSFLVAGGKQAPKSGKVFKMFPVAPYLEGWPHLKEVTSGAARKRIQKRLEDEKKGLDQMLNRWDGVDMTPDQQGIFDSVRESRDRVMVALAELKGGAPALDPREIKVQLFLESPIKHARAYWKPGFNFLGIELPRDASAWQLGSLRDSARHELQHVSQKLIGQGKGVENWTGVPEGARTPLYKQWMCHGDVCSWEQLNEAMADLGEQGALTVDLGGGRKYKRPREKVPFHALDDTEFWTDYQDAEEDFRRNLTRYPEMTPTQRANALDIYTGVLTLPTSLSDKDMDLVRELLGDYERKMAFELGPFYRALRMVPKAKPKLQLAIEEMRKEFGYKGRRRVEGRRPTPESQQWTSDIRDQKRHVQKAVKSFKRLAQNLRPLAEAAKETFPRRDKESIKRRGRFVVKALRAEPLVTRFLNHWIGTEQQHPKANSWRNSALYQFRNVLTVPGYTLRDAAEAIAKEAFKGYQAITMAEAQAPVREALPPDLQAFLPANIVVKVDADGNIQQVTDRFVNQHETLGKKISRQHDLVRRYNEIARQVKADLRGGSEMTRLAALVTAIIMETGIRPGKVGNGVVEVKDGEEVPVETFGAVTLGPKHVQFVKDFAELEFIGKMGSRNTASLSDREVIDVLKQYVDGARKGGSRFVFVTRRGQRFTYNDLQLYFKNTGPLSGLAPTDFRKLRATTMVLDRLYSEQQALYERIRGYTQDQVGDLQGRVTQEVVETLQRAQEEARAALSHDTVEVTTRAYINPEVILRFLSQGAIEKRMEEAVLGGQPALRFDPAVFVQRALGRVALSVQARTAAGATLQTLLFDLVRDMEDEGVSVPR